MLKGLFYAHYSRVHMDMDSLVRPVTPVTFWKKRGLGRLKKKWNMNFTFWVNWKNTLIRVVFTFLGVSYSFGVVVTLCRLFLFFILLLSWKVVYRQLGEKGVLLHLCGNGCPVIMMIMASQDSSCWTFCSMF